MEKDLRECAEELRDVLNCSGVHVVTIGEIQMLRSRFKMVRSEFLGWANAGECIVTATGS